MGIKESDINIRRLFEARTNWVDDINDLLLNAKRKASALSFATMARVLNRNCLLAALQGSDERIVGMAMLISALTVTGGQGFVTDFAILPACADRGTESRLAAALVTEAEHEKLRSLIYEDRHLQPSVRRALAENCFTEDPPGLFRIDFAR